MTALFSLPVSAFSLPHLHERRNAMVQKARAEHVSGRAKRASYPPWDLSGLPEYKPRQAVLGTISKWGSNYFGDSNLNTYEVESGLA